MITNILLNILAAGFVAIIVFVICLAISSYRTFRKIRSRIDKQTWIDIQDALEPRNGKEYLHEVTTLSDRHKQAIYDVHEVLYGKDWYCVDPLSPKQIDLYMYYDIKDKVNLML